MGTGTRLAGFAIGLAVLFGAAYAVGSTVGTRTLGPAGEQRAGGSVGEQRAGGSGHSHGAGGHGAAGTAHGGTAHGGSVEGPADHPVGGLAVSEAGYRLHRLSPDAVAGQPGELAFQVLGPDARPVTSFVNTHEKPLHLIVARRDLTGFQHLHPIRDEQGTWRVPLALRAAGDYRVFADFVPDGRLDTLVLGFDLAVAGDYRPVQLPAPGTEAAVDGYEVRMVADQGRARFAVSRGGVPVTDLQPYLAAYGHLVALRKGDLGYLHVHPEGGPGLSLPGPDVSFTVDLPPGGTYRLYLQFAHGGRVHTAEFTVETAEAR